MGIGVISIGLCLVGLSYLVENRSSFILAWSLSVIGIVLIVFSLLTLAKSENRDEVEPTIVSEYTLVSFSDSTELSEKASYFLRITTSADSVYAFYYQIDNGGYRLSTDSICTFYCQIDNGEYRLEQLMIEDNDVTIFETDEIAPTIIKYQRNYKYKFPGVKFMWGHVGEYYYEIYVPIDSIVQEFVLDME